MENKLNSLISIIIPFYNHLETTKQCLTSIHKHSAENKFTNFEIFLVDDNSSEQYVFSEEEKILPLHLLRNEVNLGFAKTCNYGAKEANGKYLLFLNNDTIPLNGWLEQLLTVFKNYKDVGIAGSRLLYPDNSIQHAGVAFNSDNMPFHIYQHFPSSFPGVNQLREFQAVTGACLMIERKLFDYIGGFDEQYLNGLEDIDLCLRVRETGKKIFYNPLSCLYHLEAQTRILDRTKQQKNVKLFLEKWHDKDLCDFREYYQKDLTNSKKLPKQLQAVKELSNFQEIIVAIWGAGSGGRHAVELLRFSGIKTSLFIDSDEKKWGQEILGCPIYSPNELINLKNQGKRIFIAIASVWFKEIEAKLMQLDFKPGLDYYSL